MFFHDQLSKYEFICHDDVSSAAGDALEARIGSARLQCCDKCGFIPCICDAGAVTQQHVDDSACVST